MKHQSFRLLPVVIAFIVFLLPAQLVSAGGGADKSVDDVPEIPVIDESPVEEPDDASTPGDTAEPAGSAGTENEQDPQLQLPTPAADDVPTDGSTLLVGNSGDFIDIQDALDAAAPGDTVLISEGIYEVSGSLSLTGQTDITVRGIGMVDIITKKLVHSVVIEGCRDIVIDNLHIVHKRGVSSDVCGETADVVHITDSSRIDVRNCELNGCGHIGVYAENSSGITISGNYIHSNTHTGIKIVAGETEPRQILIRDNRIINNSTVPIKFLKADIFENVNSGNLQMSGNTIYPGPGVQW